MKHKILEIISTMGEGGAESLVKDYALKIDKARFDISILTIYKVRISTTIPVLEEEGIPIQSILPGINIFWKLFKWTIGSYFIPHKIINYIRENHISCVHVHMNQLHHLVPLIKKLDGVKVIYTVHNTPSRYFIGKSGEKEINAIRNFSHKQDFKLVALHPDMANELSKMFNIHDVTYIRNGIDYDRFSKIALSKEEIRSKIGISKDAFVIGHVGRFTEQKNHIFLVDIFSKIVEKKPNSFLLLIGSGPLKKSIEEKLDMLKLKGRYLILSNRSDIPHLMKAMDLFLFPSLFEGLPVTLVEAQVSKLPCVVSNCINKEAIILKTTIQMSLNQTAEKWAELCVQTFEPIEWNQELLQFDMNNEIKKLERIYS